MTRLRTSAWEATGQVVKLAFDCWNYAAFEQSLQFDDLKRESFQIADVLFGLCEDSTPSKDHRWK